MRTASQILEGLPELKEESPRHATVEHNSSLPGDDFTARGNIELVLKKHGWTYSHTSADGNQQWTRPGKESSPSASLKDGVFHVFTSSASPFESHKGYSLFQVYALLEHGGDFNAAAVALRSQGYGGNDSEDTAVNIEGIVSKFKPAESSPEWPHPTPFESSAALPTFPVEALGADWLRGMVQAVSVGTQTPPDLAGSLALAIVGLCGAGKMRVSINESWSEPLNIFTVCSLPPGCRKSAVFEIMQKVLREWERKEAERLKPQIAEARAAMEVDEQRLKELKNRAAKEQDTAKRDKMVQEAQSLSVKLAAQTLPLLPRLFADDVTPEQLARLLSEFDGRMAVLSPEPDIFDIIAGRYSEGANIGCLLKGHAGDSLRVDRVGRPADLVDKPALTVALCCQPDVIEGLSTKPGFRGRGLLGRFLYALPKSPLGYRLVDSPSIPEAIHTRYEQRIFQLLDLPWNTEEAHGNRPYLIQLSPEARALHREFQIALEPKLAIGGELGTMTDWAGKLAGAIARIAGGLHLAKVPDFPWLREIDQATMQSAIEIGQYYTAHAQAAFAAMGADPANGKAKRVLQWLERHGKQSFSRRDVCHGLRMEVGEADLAIQILIEHDFIRSQSHVVAKQAGRKPSPTFEVNPSLIEKGTQQASLN